MFQVNGSIPRMAASLSHAKSNPKCCHQNKWTLQSKESPLFEKFPKYFVLAHTVKHVLLDHCMCREFNSRAAPNGDQ